MSADDVDRRESTFRCSYKGCSWGQKIVYIDGVAQTKEQFIRVPNPRDNGELIVCFNCLQIHKYCNEYLEKQSKKKK